MIIDPFKCTGKFKEDFENISKLKNIKFIPEVVLRGKIAWNNSDNAERSDPRHISVAKLSLKSYHLLIQLKNHIHILNQK